MKVNLEQHDSMILMKKKREKERIFYIKVKQNKTERKNTEVLKNSPI